MSLKRLGSLGIPVKELLLNMSAQELFNRCVVSNEFNEYCEDDNFWKDYLFKYTKLSQKITPLTYKQTTRLLYHFLNRLWQNNDLQLVSTYALEQMVLFWQGTYDTYDEYLDRFNSIANIFNQNAQNMFIFGTFAEIYPQVNPDFSEEEMFWDWYVYKYVLAKTQNQYLMPVVLQGITKKITYIQRDIPTSNQRLVDLNFDPDDALKFIYDALGETNVPNQNDLNEIKDFIDFSVVNFQ